MLAEFDLLASLLLSHCGLMHLFRSSYRLNQTPRLLS